MTTETKDKAASSRRAELATGNWVLIMLGVLTFGEFIVGVIAPPWGSSLLIVAAFKALFVLVYFMHIGRLFTGGEGH